MSYVQATMWHLILLLSCLGAVEAKISPHQRQKVVQAYNPRRNTSSDSTPLQVGNGNFAFGADITGLQTFKPYATLSTWGWHNFSLPTTPNQTSVDDFTGLQWWTHDRLVTYDQPNPAQNDISQWLIQNPQRVKLGNIGFAFPRDGDEKDKNVTEADLEKKTQTLDIWSGVLKSSFAYKGVPVSVNTAVDPDSDTVLVEVDSKLLQSGGLGLFFDFPYSDRNKFDAPFVGVWNATDKHTTVLQHQTSHSAVIQHSLGQTTYYLTLQWEGGEATITGPAKGTHRYFLRMNNSKKTTTRRLRLKATFLPEPLDATSTATVTTTPSFTKLLARTQNWWNTYWIAGAFVDLSRVINSKSSPSSLQANATELQRRILLSLYLLAVNSASSLPPQESGLVNNGWYGKFHLEMVLWNTLHFARWNHFPLFWRSLPTTYTLFLPSSLARAREQGYKGARWGKMTDPTGRSAPGEINSLLIWQQPHPMFFAETEWRSFPNATTLKKWEEVLEQTAEFMVYYAWFNQSTGYYDLGPPMYPVSENTNPNATINPTFELAYWRFGLDVACKWKQRQNKTVPEEWTRVRDNLAPLPVVDGTYAVYEGIPGMWRDNKTTNDHPAMAGIYGLLPAPASGQPPLDMDVLRRTAKYLKRYWALEESYGWDFSMLAMNALRLGDEEQAIEYLLHPIFQFDDAGYPVGGSRVPTPYFPNSASLLLAVAMMAGGWDGSEGKHFPKGWEEVEVDGFVPAM